jgi:hypothetical protein
MTLASKVLMQASKEAAKEAFASSTTFLKLTSKYSILFKSDSRFLFRMWTILSSQAVLGVIVREVQN